MPSRPDTGRLSPSAQAADFRTRALRNSGASPGHDSSKISTCNSQAAAAQDRNSAAPASVVGGSSSRLHSHACDRRDASYAEIHSSRPLSPHRLLDSSKSHCSRRDASAAAGHPSSRPRSPYRHADHRAASPRTASSRHDTSGHSRSSSAHADGLRAALGALRSRQNAHAASSAAHLRSTSPPVKTFRDSLKPVSSRPTGLPNAAAPSPPTDSAHCTQPSRLQLHQDNHPSVDTCTSFAGSPAPGTRHPMPTNHVHEIPPKPPLPSPSPSPSPSGPHPSPMGMHFGSQYVHSPEPKPAPEAHRRHHDSMLRRHNRSQGTPFQVIENPAYAQQQAPAWQHSEQDSGNDLTGQLSVSQRIQHFESGLGLQAADSWTAKPNAQPTLQPLPQAPHSAEASLGRMPMQIKPSSSDDFSRRQALVQPPSYRVERSSLPVQV